MEPSSPLTPLTSQPLPSHIWLTIPPVTASSPSSFQSFPSQLSKLLSKLKYMRNLFIQNSKPKLDWKHTNIKQWKIKFSYDIHKINWIGKLWSSANVTFRARTPPFLLLRDVLLGREIEKLVPEFMKKN